MISFEVRGKPVAFARAGTNSGRRYTPPQQSAYMAVVATIARASMSRAGYKPFEGPVEVSYRVTYEYPKSWSQKRRDAISWKTSKSDLDNNFKICADALTGVAYLDDAQIVSLHAQKRYGLVEGVVITVACLSDQEAAR